MNGKEILHFESIYPSGTRYREVSEVLNFIKSGQSCQVIGLPGVGQSTFLKLLAYNKSIKLAHLGQLVANYHFVLVNFSEVRKKPLDAVYKLIMISIAESLRERGYNKENEKVAKIIKESANIKDPLVVFQGLKQSLDYLILEKDLTVVLLLDRFEEYLPNLTDEFFANLRVLRSRGKHRFAVVFSLNRALDNSELLTGDFSEYFLENRVYLSIREDSILNIRLKKSEELAQRQLDRQTKEIIIELTGGFGRLVKNSTQLVLNAGLKNSDKKELIDFLLNDSLIKAPMMDIWQALVPSEQDFLLTDYTTFEENDLDYQYLRNVGLINEGKLTIPLFAIYIRRFLGEFEKKEDKEPIRFHADTDEIKKGEDVISDRLTALEFKLLKFLIDNQNMVAGREKIINAVWTDAASTAGVTDQALDQLLLRLRRKIEDDPNNPLHVQTVKGRGVRFIP